MKYEDIGVERYGEPAGLRVRTVTQSRGGQDTRGDKLETEAGEKKCSIGASYQQCQRGAIKHKNLG